MTKMKGERLGVCVVCGRKEWTTRKVCRGCRRSWVNRKSGFLDIDRLRDCMWASGRRKNAMIAAQKQQAADLWHFSPILLRLAQVVIQSKTRILLSFLERNGAVPLVEALRGVAHGIWIHRAKLPQLSRVEADQLDQFVRTRADMMPDDRPKLSD